MRNCLLSSDIRDCDKVRLAMMYFQKFPDDPLKVKIICNDMEGFNIPPDIIEKIKKLFIKPKNNQNGDHSKTKLDSFLTLDSSSKASPSEHFLMIQRAM